MISCDTNKNKFLNEFINRPKPVLYGVKLIQPSLKSFLNHNSVSSDQLTHKTQKNNQVEPENQINNENCSQNANLIPNFYSSNSLNTKSYESCQNKTFKFQNKPTNSSSIDKCKQDRKINDQSKISKTIQIVDMKKKIKKVLSDKAANDKVKKQQKFLRQKVSFSRKKYFLQEEQQIRKKDCLKDENSMDYIEVFQSFPLFADSEVFSGRKNEYFRNQIIHQRIDNDAETDEQQVQKFALRMQTELFDYMSKLKQQRPEKASLKSNQLQQSGQKLNC